MHDSQSDSTSKDAGTSSARGAVVNGRRWRGVCLLVALMICAAWNADRISEAWRDVGTSGLFAQTPETRRRPAAPRFDVTRTMIPVDEIHHGGPPKDGIPALSNPAFVPADDADQLRPTDRVIGVVIGEDARAYPIRILNYHEIVNDRLGDTPIAVTYCPLCDSSAVFDRRTTVGEREFGVSGMLYNSNVLMYDRGGQPESLWSQLIVTGVTGPGIGQSLRTLPLTVTTWQDWAERFPRSSVLSFETGHVRNYDVSPYAGYFRNENLVFPVNHTDRRLRAKEPVLGLWTANVLKAYPLREFSRTRTRVNDVVDGIAVTLEFNPDANSLRVVDAKPGVQWVYSLWFAWSAFHPETQVFAPGP